MEESGSLDGQMHEEAGITKFKSGLSMNEEALRAGSVETMTTQRPHVLPLWQAARPLFQTSYSLHSSP